MSIAKANSISFSVSIFWDNFYFLFPFSLGLLLGVIVISSLINYLFCNYREKTFACILGFSFASVFILFINMIPFIQYHFFSIVLFLEL